MSMSVAVLFGICFYCKLGALLLDPNENLSTLICVAPSDCNFLPIAMVGLAASVLSEVCLEPGTAGWK